MVKCFDNENIIRKLLSWNARQLGVLPLLDKVTLNTKKIYNFFNNQQFIKKHPDFPVPPAHLAYDAYNDILWDAYYQSGISVAEFLSDLIVAHLGTKAVRVIEWGCGPARIIRHLPQLLDNKSEIFGSDYNKETISWCRDNISGVTFYENQLAPPLSITDEYVDCIYGFSVLTHLSEKMCKAWIKDLLRVTRKGGIVIISTKGEVQVDRLMSHEKRIINENKPVFRGKVLEGSKMYDTILPSEYVKNELLSGLDVICHISPEKKSSNHEQDIYIIRKS